MNTQRYEEAEIKGQAALLDNDMPNMRTKYLGKTIVYFNHEALANGNNIEEVIQRIPKDKLNLPFVIRLITESNEDFMGGLKN